MPGILQAGPNAFRVHPVDELGLLIDAADYYRAFYQAALNAEHSILLSGWQFDSEVQLLRGVEAERSSTPTTLLKFLNQLCARKPALRIWILAWDFSLVFAAEREWMQRVVFEWSSDERVQFRFDSNHVERGCHHQKFVVIDGEVAFLGGLDLCDDRWDDRQHLVRNPLRVSRGEPHKPFHDIQAYVRGRALAASLRELFAERWQRAGGEPIGLPDGASAQAPPAAAPPEGDPRAGSAGERESAPPEGDAPSGAAVREETVSKNVSHGRLGLDALHRLPAAEAALSRTDPYGAPGGPAQCTEILALHRAAIASAEKLIYLETQYFSAQTIFDAFAERLRDHTRGPLEIVMILNMRGETLKEQAAVGLAQAQIIGRLRQLASETPHRLGIYFTLPECNVPETPEHATYIHSKLLIVDDRLLTVGSANLTNRSMAVDTELNLSVETDDANSALALAIRKLRASLLAEHTGGPELACAEGLVAHLDQLTERAWEPGQAVCRLRRHPSPTISERAALVVVDPQRLPFDPSAVEEFDEEAKLDFVSGLSRAVRELFANRKDKG